MKDNEQEYLNGLMELKRIDVDEKKWLLSYFELYKFTLNWPDGLPPINRTNLIDGTHRTNFNFNYTAILNCYDYKFDNNKKILLSLNKKDNTIELLKLFISASQSADIIVIESLLSEDGVFEIEDENLELVDTTKEYFLKWYKNKLKETPINEVDTDQCIGCSFGKQVVIFNKGTFPRIPQSFTEKTKSGIMVDTLNDKISKLQFCFSFLKMENKHVCDCVGEEYVKYIKEGYTEEEAVALYDADPNSEYGYITRNISDDEDDDFLPF
jgi:hypothetical protein